MLDPIAQGGRAGEFALIVFRPPNADTRPLIDFDRRIKNDRRWGVAIIERSRVDKRFEGRAGLAQRLRGSVELALIEGEAANHGEHAAGPWIFDHHGAGDFGHLMQTELAFGFGRLDIDNVAGADDLADLADRLPTRFCPLHSFERQYSDRAFFAHKAARFTARLQSNPR